MCTLTSFFCRYSLSIEISCPGKQLYIRLKSYKENNPRETYLISTKRAFSDWENKLFYTTSRCMMPRAMFSIFQFIIKEYEFLFRTIFWNYKKSLVDARSLISLLNMCALAISAHFSFYCNLFQCNAPVWYTNR